MAAAAAATWPQRRALAMMGVDGDLCSCFVFNCGNLSLLCVASRTRSRRIGQQTPNGSASPSRAGDQGSMTVRPRPRARTAWYAPLLGWHVHAHRLQPLNYLQARALRPAGGSSVLEKGLVVVELGLSDQKRHRVIHEIVVREEGAAACDLAVTPGGQKMR